MHTPTAKCHQTNQKHITRSLCNIYKGDDKHAIKDMSQKRRADVMALGFKTKYLYCTGRPTLDDRPDGMTWIDLKRNPSYPPACFDDKRCGYTHEADTWRSVGANIVCDLRRNAFDWAMSGMMMHEFQKRCPNFHSQLTNTNVGNKNKDCVAQQTGTLGTVNVTDLLWRVKAAELKYVGGS